MCQAPTSTTRHGLPQFSSLVTLKRSPTCALRFALAPLLVGDFIASLDSRMMRRIAGANGVIVTLCVMVWYLAFTIAGLALHDGDPRWCVYFGTYYAEGNGQGSTGYDGQFAYYLARDTGSAWMHMDVPAYRYQR